MCKIKNRLAFNETAIKTNKLFYKEILNLVKINLPLKPN
jgi:hypothetical protein